MPPVASLPAIAPWRIHALRVVFLLMALVMGTLVWGQLLMDADGWSWERGLAKSMLAALALLSLLGLRYPVQMLPLMLYEVTWKTVWLLLIALRAWLSGTWNAGIEALFFDCIGIVLAYFIVPWRYVWARYIAHPMEPWRSPPPDATT